ncbi:alpha-1,2-fucosyltransferase [Bacteroidia bacterium]|nr:alpha-1,2-fucosyltransferase [Bacteroidia bacterium]
MNNYLNIIKISGGLANQMIQYAFGVALEKCTGIQTVYDTAWFGNTKRQQTVRSFGLSVFNIPDRVFILFKKPSFLVRLVSKYHRIRQRSRHWNDFDPKLLQLPAGMNYISGYFQNERYLDLVKDTLAERFTLKKPLNGENLRLLNDIQKTTSVSIHVRRGDYIKFSDTYPVCSPEYYRQAMQIIESRVPSPHYFLFSDDIAWCKTHIKADKPLTIVDVNSGENGYLDMELMKNCRHNIIANSSFSWMATYLNPNPDKIVIAPQAWIKKNGEILPNIGLGENINVCL